ncbi:hypothetical protein CDAR_223061, partial [Caerostris darwini]
ENEPMDSNFWKVMEQLSKDYTHHGCHLRR